MNPVNKEETHRVKEEAVVDWAVQAVETQTLAMKIRTIYTDRWRNNNKSHFQFTNF